MFDLAATQRSLGEFDVDGWLLCDFRNTNPLARRILGMSDDVIQSRRFFYFVPSQGTPRKLVHRIEQGALDHLPGEKTVYLRWQELEAGIADLIGDARRIAMEYSPRNANPYVSRVDAGLMELVRSCGPEVVSSADLVQLFEAVWSDEQWAMHRQAGVVTDAAFGVAWDLIREKVCAGGHVEEAEVRDAIMHHFQEHGCTTYHPPIVGVNENSGDPHYETGTGARTAIGAGDFVLVDLWAKLDRPEAVYSDMTRVAFVGAEVPERHAEIFKIVAAARDAAIGLVRTAFAGGRTLQGWEVDEVTRGVISDAGYGEQFAHRTGHSIGQEVHGNGANMDNLETREERMVLPGTCFSVEPGIYLPEFGVRSEVNVFVDRDRVVHVTAGDVQTEILALL